MTSKNEIAKNFTLSMLDALREEIVKEHIYTHEYCFFKESLMAGLQYFENTRITETPKSSNDAV